MKAVSISEQRDDSLLYQKERAALAASFRWAARLNLHEGVANHFSLAVGDGTRFLLNPNQRHFSRIRASDLLLLDVDDTGVLEQDDAPDPTAWGLHGSVHRHCPRARCIMHAHPIYSTVLASLSDSTMPPIDQNTATFFNRYVVDNSYGGLAFSEEGERCAELLSGTRCNVMIMGNHGIMIIGKDVADAFNRLFYFERSAETYIKALWTQKPLRVLSDELAERTAQSLEDYPGQGDRHFNELLAILDAEESDYAD